jgi:hypothetical protein
VTDFDRHHRQAIAVFPHGLIAQRVPLSSAAQVWLANRCKSGELCYTIPGSARIKLEGPPS